MPSLQETLDLLEEKVTKVADEETARLTQERAFLISVRDKSLGGATAKDDAAKESAVLTDVRALLGLG